VLLRVTSRRGLQNTGKRGKLAPRYVGPFRILSRIGPVAYKLALPPQFSGMHDVFHVSTLRKYMYDESHVIRYDDLDVQDDISIEDRPVKILERKQIILRNRAISLVKILWSHNSEKEATWEHEDQIRKQYPELFIEPGMTLNMKFRGRNLLRREECNIREK